MTLIKKYSEGETDENYIRKIKKLPQNIYDNSSIFLIDFIQEEFKNNDTNNSIKKFKDYRNNIIKKLIIFYKICIKELCRIKNKILLKPEQLQKLLSEKSKSNKEGNQESVNRGRGSQGNRGRGSQGNRGRGSQGNRGRGSQGNRGRGSQGNRGRGSQGNRGRGSQGNRGRGSQGNRGRGSQGNRGRGSQGNRGRGSQGNRGRGSQGNR